MEIFFSILAAIFAVIASIFGVRNRIHSSRPGTGSNLRDEGSRYNDNVRRDRQLEQLEQRAIDSIERVNSIKQRIRKREQPAPTAEPETNTNE